MKYILIFISIILFPFLSYSQTQRAESIVIPVSALGDVTETRKQILQNTLEEKLKRFFKLISQERFEEAQEQAFEELDFQECTEDQCIMMIQELLQVENAFHLQIIVEGQDTQLSLSWRTLDEKKKETDICRGCDTFALNERIENLVDKLMQGLPSEETLAQKKEEEAKREKEEEAKRKQEEERKKWEAIELERKIEKEKKLAKQKEEDEKWAKKQSELWGKNEHTGYSLNLFSPLGYPDNQNVRGFRFNLLYGDHENVRGVDLGFVNKSKTFHGFQTTPFAGVNIVTEEMRGVQFNIFGLNYAKKGGYQLGLFTLNIAEEAKLQLSFLNWSKSVGSQFSLLNVATDDAVSQISLLGNYAGRAEIQFALTANIAASEAQQISPLGNYAGKTRFQVGILNYAETLEGFQIGFINIAKYSKGCQFGIINLTTNKESGFPLIPFVNCSM